MALLLERLISSKTYTDQKKFDCEHTVINHFVRTSLKQQVKQNNSVAWVLLDTDHNDRLVGFFTLTMAQVDQSLVAALSPKSLPKQVPCVRLVMLGVDKFYKGNNLGLRLLKHALLETKQAASTVGCRGLYLDADPKAVNFYLKYGFHALGQISTTTPTPMFLFMESFF